MSDPKHEKTVAVVNSNEDTVEMLRACLQGHGFSSVITGHVNDFKRGVTDFPRFVERYDPAVIVYDISLPYEQNWTFLRLLLDTESMQGRRVVVTTTNKSRLDELVGPTDAIEIVGKPYDLDRIVEAVKNALATA
jgi:DNA-binding NtrC family response regulator